MVNEHVGNFFSIPRNTFFIYLLGSSSISTLKGLNIKRGKIPAGNHILGLIIVSREQASKFWSISWHDCDWGFDW